MFRIGGREHGNIHRCLRDILHTLAMVGMYIILRRVGAIGLKQEPTIIFMTIVQRYHTV
jgi:hypothetical protein